MTKLPGPKEKQVIRLMVYMIAVIVVCLWDNHYPIFSIFGIFSDEDKMTGLILRVFSQLIFLPALVAAIIFISMHNKDMGKIRLVVLISLILVVINYLLGWPTCFVTILVLIIAAVAEYAVFDLSKE